MKDRTTRAYYPFSESDAGNPTKERQNEAFREHLAYEAPAAPAESAPYGHLALTSRCPRKLNIRNVYTSNQQHKCCEHQKQCGDNRNEASDKSRRSGQSLWNYTNGDSLICCGKLGCQ